MIDFRTDPSRYRHWRLAIRAPIARLILDVAEDASRELGYSLKQNSYDLGVDIELYDATQRLRFEHPEVKVVVIESGKDRVFCAGANIGMLAAASPALKINFCKFTNETRLAIEDASRCSQQRYLCAIRGTAAGGGYELALACDWIVLADDGSSAVSLPEVSLLGVLPGTGGLTRLVDQRRVRRDRADVFCTLAEGIKGRRALEWGLVDELAPRSRFDEVVTARSIALAADSDRPADGRGLVLEPLGRELGERSLEYSHLRVDWDPERGVGAITVLGPATPPPAGPADLDGSFYPLALGRELEDALLHLRFAEPGIGLWLIRSEGSPAAVAGHDAFLHAHSDHWLVREVVSLWKRTLKRLEVGSRTLFALADTGSCFVGFLAELLFAADRTYAHSVDSADSAASGACVRLSPMNFGPLPMANGLSRLETRFLGDPGALEGARKLVDRDLDARAAAAAGLVTAALDEVDWEDETRIAIEERASFSGDSLTGLEANLRFAGPETVETKIFGRLSAWQNWIFQRPSATGEAGALRRYGTGVRPALGTERM